MNITDTTTETYVSGITVTLTSGEVEHIIRALGGEYSLSDPLRREFQKALGSKDGLTETLADASSPLRRVLADGKKIFAIKEVRSIMQWDLKEAKDWVDAYIRLHPQHWDSIAKAKDEDARLADLRAQLTSTPQDAPLALWEGVPYHHHRDS